ncbi:MAG: 50S ribosomal protein L9 [Chloroflexi bacterium]|nr:50S ribosomal protein L9 [Chloroflexota bacterium]
MKIILTSEVHNLGQAGDVKEVTTGYARNYLIPQGLAIRATAGAIKEFERKQTAELRREEQLAARAEALVERLNKVILNFEAKASEKGRLFGSITTADIAQALEREIGEKFDRRKHIASEPLRTVGEHTISVRLTSEIVAEVKAIVKPEGGELPEVTPEEPVEEPTPTDEQPEAEE